MKNPYEVLGVRQNASQDEIRAAYKELVKKYHPDRYQNNPLADLAQEKLQEINEAYDTLTKNGNGNYSNFNNNASYQSTGTHQNAPTQEFMEIRRYLDLGNLSAAEQMLAQISNRNAEWFFLSGILSYRKGWYDDASSKIKTAVSMDPSNFEYQRALNSIMNAGQAYRNVSYGKGYSSNDG
ncbi:J domain-containing protein [Anaerovorax sp. IOR16]|uniref:J domain-containing protein n=1 Tax=Anaerovorax sp. IOR16 TaxID=2773458 RepID=UPI001FD649AE|nr:DnaJ domain-containing protein [Anaerovorax sp. IOR16]